MSKKRSDESAKIRLIHSTLVIFILVAVLLILFAVFEPTECPHFYVVFRLENASILKSDKMQNETLNYSLSIVKIAITFATTPFCRI